MNIIDFIFFLYYFFMRYGTETLNVCVIMCWYLAVMKYRLEIEVALV